MGGSFNEFPDNIGMRQDDMKGFVKPSQ